MPFKESNTSLRDQVKRLGEKREGSILDRIAADAARAALAVRTQKADKVPDPPRVTTRPRLRALHIAPRAPRS